MGEQQKKEEAQKLEEQRKKEEAKKLEEQKEKEVAKKLEEQRNREEAKKLEEKTKKKEAEKLEDHRKKKEEVKVDEGKQHEVKKLEEIKVENEIAEKQLKKIDDGKNEYESGQKHNLQEDLKEDRPTVGNIEKGRSEDIKHQNQMKRQEDFLAKMRQSEEQNKKNIKSMFENISNPISKSNNSPAFKRKDSKKEDLHKGEDSLQTDLQVLSEVKKQTELLMSQHKKATQEKSQLTSTTIKQNESVKDKSHDLLVENNKSTSNPQIDKNNGIEEIGSFKEEVRKEWPSQIVTVSTNSFMPKKLDKNETEFIKIGSPSQIRKAVITNVKLDETVDKNDQNYKISKVPTTTFEFKIPTKKSDNNVADQNKAKKVSTTDQLPTLSLKKTSIMRPPPPTSRPPPPPKL